VVLPIEPGAAYLALRAGVPIVPLAINGNGWLRFRGRVRLRIGAPVYGKSPVALRPGADDVGAMAAGVRSTLLSMTEDAQDRPRPGQLEAWLTELFHDWPEGARPEVPTEEAASADQG
jgi:1-acyl-sn-glycerol-3-phosphate acyltransferase